MNISSRVRIYRPIPICSICGNSMNLASGKRGKFYSCSDYPNCLGSKDAVEVSFSVYKVNGLEIFNNSKISCDIDGKHYESLDIVLRDGCFGVEVDNAFTPIKACKNISKHDS